MMRGFLLVFKTFWSPGSAFEEIAESPVRSWAAILVLTIVGLISTGVITATVDPAEMALRAMEQSPQGANLTEEQKGQFVERLNNPAVRYIGFAGALVGPTVLIAVLSGIYFGIFMILGSSAKTLAQARRSPSFWIYSAGLSIHALFGTAVTFHIVSIFADAGRDRIEAFAYFLPQAMVATSVNLVASWLVDRHRLKPFLVIMLSGFLIGAIGLINLDTRWGYLMLISGFGLGGGLWGVISNIAFIRLFGTLHLGEISGLNTALTVLASAIGPFLFSVGYDLSGSYQAPELLCATALACLLIAAIAIRQPDDVAQRGLH